MSEVKKVQGIIPCQKAREDTRVVIDEAFSVLVPAGMSFSTDQSEIGEDKIFSMFTPPDPAYMEIFTGLFNDDSVMAQYNNSPERFFIRAGFHKFSNELDLSIAENRKSAEKALTAGLKPIIEQITATTGEESLPPLIVQSNEKAVVAASVNGLFGNATFYVAIPSGFYTGNYFTVENVDGGENAPAVFGKTAEKLLGSFEFEKRRAAVLPENLELGPLPVYDLKYTLGLRVEVGAISVPLPNCTKCALSNATDEVEDAIPYDLADKIDFICIPENYSKGYGAYRDAPFSVFCNKPLLLNGLEEDWNIYPVEDIVTKLMAMFENGMNKQPMTTPAKAVQTEKGFMSCYCLYSGDNSENFWRSYAFCIVTGGIFISGMFYFNQKRAESEFEDAVKCWLSKVYPANQGTAEGVKDALSKEQLGPYAAENGKLDAFLITRLFSEDVLFFPETPFERDGDTAKPNLQFNTEKQEEHPFFVQNIENLSPALEELFLRLDSEEKLQVPKNRLHQRLLEPLLDNRLTGLSFLNLLAYHMVTIENGLEPDSYSVMVEENVIAGIPGAYRYICEFIGFTRRYNEIAGAFTVKFLAVGNEGPVTEQLSPVAGADKVQFPGSIRDFTVKADGTIIDNDAPPKNISYEIWHPSPEEEAVVALKKAKRSAQDKLDSAGKTLAESIEYNLEKLTERFRSRAEFQANILAHGMYDGRWDPRLKEDIAVFDQIMDEYGTAAEALIQTGLKKYDEIKSVLSAKTALSVVEAVQSVIDEVDEASIDNYELSIHHEFWWNIDDSAIKALLRRERAELSELAKKQQAERSKEIREETEFEEAKKYGVPPCDLLKHKRYLSAKDKMSKAKTSAEYFAAAAEFEKLYSYRNSADLAGECKMQAEKIEAAERRAKKLLEEWELSCAEIKSKRAELKESLEKELREKYKEKLSALENEQRKTEAEKLAKRNELSKKAEQLEKELKSAGIFAVSKKKKLKAEIMALETAKTDAAKDKLDILSRYDDEKKALRDELSMKLKSIVQEIEQKLPLPDKPLEIQNLTEEKNT